MSLIVDWLGQRGLEITRENYLKLAYPDIDPADYTEAMLE